MGVLQQNSEFTDILLARFVEIFLIKKLNIFCIIKNETFSQT